MFHGCTCLSQLSWLGLARQAVAAGEERLGLAHREPILASSDSIGAQNDLCW